MKKGKIYLTSGGYIDGQRGEKLDKIIEKLCKEKRILIVDNATTTGSNLKGKENVKNNFDKLSNRVVYNCTLTAENLKGIHNFDVIYILGGDIAPLIELAEKIDIAKELKAFIESGKTIVGESAGSMIFGKDIKWIYDIKKGTKEKWNRELSSYRGFGFADINIFPHWNKVSEDLAEKTLEYEKNHDIKITRLSDGEWIEISLD